MPWYCYKCIKCGEIYDEFLSVADRNKTQNCGVCGSKLIRDFQTECPNVEIENLRHSAAMAIRPEDIPVAVKRWPGSEYDKRGHLIIHNRKEKLKRAKERGLQELD